MWCSPYRSVLPMYMPGRLRTALRPSRTSMLAPAYSPITGCTAPLGLDSSCSGSRSSGSATRMCSVRSVDALARTQSAGRAGFEVGAFGVEDHGRDYQAAGDIRVAENAGNDAVRCLHAAGEDVPDARHATQ